LHWPVSDKSVAPSVEIALIPNTGGAEFPCQRAVTTDKSGFRGLAFIPSAGDSLFFSQTLVSVVELLFQGNFHAGSCGSAD
jgi:hypothetical protein